METILQKRNYRDYRLWRPNTETPYYLYMYIDPIRRPCTKILYIYKSFCKTKLIAKKNEFDCKNNELDRKTL